MGLVGMAAAAVAFMNRLGNLEPALASGVTTTIKQGVIQSIVGGIATVICSLLGIRTTGVGMSSRGRFTRRDIDVDDD